MLPKNSHVTEQELLLAADGELSERRAGEVRAHLTACWDCRARMAEMEIAITDFARAYRRELGSQLPPIDGVERIDLVDGTGTVVASIENQPGKQGSLAVYQYLAQIFGPLAVKAAEHGLAVFAEHTADARNRPGVHPNIDHLLAIVAGGTPLSIEIIPAIR